jgi:ubiquinone/menaquinone biosynthesis C-methylase UbiE
VPRRDASIDFDRVADRYDETRGGEDRGRRLAAELAPWLGPDGLTLEVGVGTGLVASALQARGRAVVGVDLAPRMLTRARDRLGAVVALADAHELPIRPAAVANVCIVWVLHAVADAGIVISECQRVLRFGGRLVIASGRPRSEPGDTERIPRQRSNQPSIRSTSALVSPQGLSGWTGWSSPTGRRSGVPYTAHDDENTRRCTPQRWSVLRSRAVPPTLLAK